MLQFCAEKNAECQAEVRVLEVAAEHLCDVGEAIQQRRAVQIQRRRRFGDGKVVVEIDAQRLQIRDLRAFVVRLQLLQPVRVIDPRRSACQRTGEELRQQIVLKIKDRAASILQEPVLQRAGRLKPRLIGLIQIGKRARYAADQAEPVQKRQKLRSGFVFSLRSGQKRGDGALKLKYEVALFNPPSYQSGIGVRAIRMTARIAPANAAAPMAANTFLLSFFFAALQISAAQAVQTAAATSAMPSVSHSQESSWFLH